MAINKKVLVLVVVAIAVVQSVAFGLAFSEFSELPQEDYSIEGELVYAYLKTYTVSEDVDGIGNRKLVSYVLVLNITNPNDVPVYLKRAQVDLMENAVQVGTSVSGTNSIIRYTSSLPDNDFSYYWAPHSSRFVAFTATGELSGMALDALQLGKGYFLVKVDGRTETDSHVGGDLNLEEVPLEVMDNDEYVFNTAFRDNYRFRFWNDDINLAYEW
jgi:hypothetical protein